MYCDAIEQEFVAQAVGKALSCKGPLSDRWTRLDTRLTSQGILGRCIRSITSKGKETHERADENNLALDAVLNHEFRSGLSGGET